MPSRPVSIPTYTKNVSQIQSGLQVKAAPHVNNFTNIETTAASMETTVEDHDERFKGIERQSFVKYFDDSKVSTGTNTITIGGAATIINTIDSAGGYTEITGFADSGSISVSGITDGVMWAISNTLTYQATSSTAARPSNGYRVFTFTNSGGAVTVNPKTFENAIDADNHIFSGSFEVREGAKLNGLDLNYTSQTTDYTLLVTDNYVELGSGAAANRTFTLPAAASKAGQTFTVSNRNTTYKVTIDGNASETIDGLTTLEIWPGNTITFYSDGTNWVSQKHQGRGRVLISRKIVSAVSAVEFTNLPSYFSYFEIDFHEVFASANTRAVIRLSNDGGGSYISSASSYNGTTLEFNGSGTNSGGDTTQLPLTGSVAGSQIGTTIATSAAGNVKLFNLLNGSAYSAIRGSVQLRRVSDGDDIGQILSGYRNATEINNAIQISAATGNITGTFSFYGVY